MKLGIKVVSGMAILLASSLVLPVTAQEKQEKKAEEKKSAEPAKAKAEKVSGDIGLLDTEKNYMIVVTKDGKLVTLDYNTKTKATEIKETKVKMAEVGLGSTANVEYVTKGEKNFLTKMEFTPANRCAPFKSFLMGSNRSNCSTLRSVNRIADGPVFNAPSRRVCRGCPAARRAPATCANERRASARPAAAPARSWRGPDGRRACRFHESRCSSRARSRLPSRRPARP